MSVTGFVLHVAAAVVGQTGATPPAAPALHKTLLDYITAGGVVGYLLVLLSFVALALAIMNLIQLRRSQLAPPDSVMHLDQLIRAGRMSEVTAYCQIPEAASFLTRVLGMALARCARSPFGFLEIRTAVDEAGQKEMDRLARVTDLLGLIASLGPMMGLLGTVIGMIGAFASIGEAEGPSRSQLLATYMSMALVTTAEGLIVAIPCTVAYALFRKRTERLAVQVGEIIEEWLPFLEPSGAAAPSAPGPGRGTAPARTAPGPETARVARTA
jgi:biopolymer transport protein ExbB